MSRTPKLDVVGILQEHGAILEGHYRLPSGLHTSKFVQPERVLQFPNLARKFAAAICRNFPEKADVVVSSSMGGLVLGQEVARERKCRSIFFERFGGVMGLRPHFHLKRGERVLIVEDVLMAGRTTGELIHTAAELGATVIGVGVVVDRSTGALDLGVPVRALVTLPIPVSTSEDCSACTRKVPLSAPYENGTGGK
ncbi:MAG: orotate phosphoribosyltransferase [Elusimicrobia bacterium]|nr:MAG: orotate phosphoribosyltransferase [Elusimicrobiota bacterium]